MRLHPNLNLEKKDHTELYVIIKEFLKNQCVHPYYNGRHNTCLYFNLNPTVAVNKLANLCFLEELTDHTSTSFSYPLTNKYYCMGYATSALEEQMRYDFPVN